MCLYECGVVGKTAKEQHQGDAGSAVSLASDRRLTSRRGHPPIRQSPGGASRFAMQREPRRTPSAALPDVLDLPEVGFETLT